MWPCDFGLELAMHCCHSWNHKKKGHSQAHFAQRQWPVGPSWTVARVEGCRLSYSFCHIWSFPVCLQAPGVLRWNGMDKKGQWKLGLGRPVKATAENITGWLVCSVGKSALRRLAGLAYKSAKRTLKALTPLGRYLNQLCGELAAWQIRSAHYLCTFWKKLRWTKSTLLGLGAGAIKCVIEIRSEMLKELERNNFLHKYFKAWQTSCMRVGFVYAWKEKFAWLKLSCWAAFNVGLCVFFFVCVCSNGIFSFRSF